MLILTGGADRWSAKNLVVAMQMPGHQYTWGALLAVFAVAKLTGRAARKHTGISSGLIAFWCYGLFFAQIVTVIDDDNAGTIGPAAWFLIGTIYLALAAKDNVSHIVSLIHRLIHRWD